MPFLITAQHWVFFITVVTDVGAGSPKARNDGWLPKEIRVGCGGLRWFETSVGWVLEMAAKAPLGHLRRLLRFITVVPKKTIQTH